MGPPPQLLETFKSLFGEKARSTREEARQAALKLGWLVDQVERKD